MLLLGADREHFQALVFHLIGDAYHRVEHESHSAGDDLRKGRSVAAEGHMRHLRSGLRCNQGRGEMRRAAIARRGVKNLARFCHSRARSPSTERNTWPTS